MWNDILPSWPLSSVIILLYLVTRRKDKIRYLNRLDYLALMGQTWGTFIPRKVLAEPSATYNIYRLADSVFTGRAFHRNKTKSVTKLHPTLRMDVMSLRLSSYAGLKHVCCCQFAGKYARHYKKTRWNASAHVETRYGVTFILEVE